MYSIGGSSFRRNSASSKQARGMENAKDLGMAGVLSEDTDQTNKENIGDWGNALAARTTYSSGFLLKDMPRTVRLLLPKHAGL